MTPFCRMAALPAREILGGTVTGHYAHLAGVTVGEVTLKSGTVVPMHDHPHEQVTYVVEGRFQFTVGDATTVLEAGSAALIPGGVVHGGTTLTACKVIDVFSPPRDDYR